MNVLCIVWGILAVISCCIGFIPCLGSLNWVNIPFASLGIVFCIITFVIAKGGKNTGAVIGIILCLFAVIAGSIRLAFGGGIF